MLLTLTTNDPYHANYCTEEGQVIYKVESPFKLVGRKATIDKIVPNDTPEGAQGEPDMQDRFTRIGLVEFNTVTSSKITWENVIHDTSKFFRKESMGWLGRDRIFTGPDGKEYRWLLRNSKPELVLNDDERTLVAKYHQKHHGVVQDPRPASLEILPPGEHMVDLIIVTLVYIELLRRNRERAAKSP
ncbi:hypothetical protein CC1G_04884 [Coprinopsis cinerea okayama7|uniref:DUF6593 domain-containing protein n=1 Tax=Coprinopsis cinerea (strain Okayama-7 / 130 / ATCC MYA-4618 / FGSC 9003) TaxID=240176 RepID=A8PFX6_COPC7|nr:hypothetical protein CC1G_04884 [Coprinopsis cinerea okayama7\|eukprot:XP_001841040.1 hypothetical protein CC1G_04884 [Coprinopsis cinerea okayama7\